MWTGWFVCPVLFQNLAHAPKPTSEQQHTGTSPLWSWQSFSACQEPNPAFLECWGISKEDLCCLGGSDLCHVHHGIVREAAVSAAAGFLSIFHLIEFASCIKNNIFTSNESNWHGQDFTRSCQWKTLVKWLIVPRDGCKSSFSSRGYSRTGIIKEWCWLVVWGTIHYFCHSDLILNNSFIPSIFILQGFYYYY